MNLQSKASKKDHPAAQTNLGWMYENGKGVLMDETKAVFWYRKAALLGQAEGQLNLAIKYKNGKGVEKD